MAKRYYWLKLKDDFFDGDTLRYIEEQENGFIYSNFYLKLCLKSLKSDGILMRLVGTRMIPHDVASLAKLTNVPEETVAVAMQLFEKIGLVERSEKGEIMLPQINEMIGSETDKAENMRRKRATDKLRGNIVTGTLPECYLENRDKEIRDKEKDIETDKENRDTDTEKEPLPEQLMEDTLLPEAEQTFKPNSVNPHDNRSHSQQVPYQQIQNLYNDTCTHLPRCHLISESRKRVIRARFREGKRLEDFKMLFEKAETSYFLRGENPRGWTASFDWLIKESNMVKVLDGNYDNRGGIVDVCGFDLKTAGQDANRRFEEISGGLQL